MILSDAKIIEALDRGHIVIDPRPHPPPGDPDSPYNTTALDLRLGFVLAKPRRDKPITYDLSARSFKEFQDQDCAKIDLRETGCYVLRPNEYVLGHTLEIVGLPLPKADGDSVYAARVEGKSSIARLGLLIHFTAPTIHAGFRGRITLEMINLGTYPLTLCPGAYICQLIFEQVLGMPLSGQSQFQGQMTPAGTK